MRWMLKALPIATALLLIFSTFGCTVDRGQSAASSGTSANVREDQIVERLKGEGLRNIQLQKEVQGWTANAITPDFRPVTIRMDERGNVLGARSY